MFFFGNNKEGGLLLFNVRCDKIFTIKWINVMKEQFGTEYCGKFHKIFSISMKEFSLKEKI